MNEFKEAKEYINNAKKICIVGHENPDGDSIGSCMALYLSLKKLNKDVDVIIPKHSDIFNFLPYLDKVKKNIEDEEIDLLITVDSSDLERVALSNEDVKKAKNIIMIDHHKRFKVYGEVQIIDDTSPATCQLLYEFLKYLNVEMDKDIATYIYCGILTDTGSFNYATTNARTFMIASELLETGINFSHICKRLNDTMKESKLKLIEAAINNMEVYENGKIRYTYIDYDTLAKLGVDDEEAEGMTNYLRMVEGTEVAIYVRERKNGNNKVSLRSGEKVDVSHIAILFGGGGHKRASGFTMTEDVVTSKHKLLKEIKKIL